MKYFLISDNIDTLAGLRMVGVDGVVVHETEELREALEKAEADKDVGLILVTSKLFAENASLLFDHKMRRTEPLIIEMPDRHNPEQAGESIKRYIAEVVGIKL